MDRLHQQLILKNRSRRVVSPPDNTMKMEFGFRDIY